MNYTELVTAIQEYTENSESTFVGQIPQFARSTEQKIYRAARVQPIRATSASTITAGTGTFTVDDMLNPLSLRVQDSGDSDNPWTSVQIKDASFMEVAYPVENAANRGAPEVYAIDRIDSGDTDATIVIVRPIPDTTYNYRFDYQTFPTSIVTASSNWVSENAESALLYGCLVEAAIFMKEEADVIAMYKEQFGVELQLLTSENIDVSRDESYGNSVSATPNEAV